MYLKGPYCSNFENVFTDLAHFSHSLSQDSCDWLFRKNKRFKHKVGVTSVFIARSVPKACKKLCLSFLFKNLDTSKVNIHSCKSKFTIESKEQ